MSIETTGIVGDFLMLTGMVWYVICLLVIFLVFFQRPIRSLSRASERAAILNYAKLCPAGKVQRVLGTAGSVKCDGFLIRTINNLNTAKFDNQDRIALGRLLADPNKEVRIAAIGKLAGGGRTLGRVSS